MAAGEGIQRIRRLFGQELPNRTRCQMPELISELQPVLDAMALNAGGVSVDVSHPMPELVIAGCEFSMCCAH